MTEFQIRPPTCGHARWQIKGTEPIGSGTCLDCGKVVGLAELFNKLHKRMEDLLTRLEKKLGGH